MSLESVRLPSAVEDQSKQCRICLDDDDPDDIISPCLCSGGSAYVHRKCLNNWRSENIGGRGFKYCDICKFEYVIESVSTDLKAERTRLFKYYCFVTRDSLAMFLFIQIIILLIAFLLKRVDRKYESIKELFPQFIRGFMIYYLSAIILLFAIIGLITLIILACAYGLRGNGGSSSCNLNGLCASIVAFILICAVIGLVVGIVATVFILRKIMQHHTGKLWLRQEAEKYSIRDFQGRREELEQYKTSSRANSSTGN